MNETGGISVSELNLLIAEAIRREPRIRSVTVRGEVSGFRHHMASGHWYFSLKDEESAVSCVMFRQNTFHARIRPKDGDRILISGYVDVYPKNGSYPLYAMSLRPDGTGDLFLQFEQLKQRLSAEGLFDQARKRRLPMVPRKVAVVTSASGAAWHDILNVSGMRCPDIPIVLVPVTVQGAGAGKEIAEGILKADMETDADVIIVARGGGSAEDLWCFNDEAVARAIAACVKPVVSGVGHEIDTTICDLAADVRASTPSNAAEIVFPDRRELTGRVNLCRSGLIRAHMGKLQQAELDLRNMVRRLSALSPEKRITLLMNRKELLRLQLCGSMGSKLDGACKTLNDAKTTLQISAVNRLKEAEHTSSRLRERLTAVSPMAALNRGYALVYDEDKRLLTRAAEAKKQTGMTLQFADGRVAVTRKETP